MATPKIEEFTNEEIFLADIAKALSHPARIKIMKLLSEMNACVCGEIVNLLPLAQATVSQHLKELKRVELIQGDIDGPKVCYCVNVNTLQKITKDFQNYFNNLNKGEKISCKPKMK
ncbi:MAG: metalloregulator ArsR/SmtB family transcription factor [Ignavibacteriaceae bacterium]|nr:metalloregulator ArsR/SmtB family transcription factor [Ignavibacteriaceae bacterium]